MRSSRFPIVYWWCTTAQFAKSCPMLTLSVGQCSARRDDVDYGPKGLSTTCGTRLGDGARNDAVVQRHRGGTGYDSRVERVSRREYLVNCRGSTRIRVRHVRKFNAAP